MVGVEVLKEHAVSGGKDFGTPREWTAEVRLLGKIRRVRFHVAEKVPVGHVRLFAVVALQSVVLLPLVVQTSSGRYEVRLALGERTGELPRGVSMNFQVISEASVGLGQNAAILEEADEAAITRALTMLKHEMLFQLIHPLEVSLVT